MTFQKVIVSVCVAGIFLILLALSVRGCLSSFAPAPAGPVAEEPKKGPAAKPTVPPTAEADDTAEFLRRVHREGIEEYVFEEAKGKSAELAAETAKEKAKLKKVPEFVEIREKLSAEEVRRKQQEVALARASEEDARDGIKSLRKRIFELEYNVAFLKKKLVDSRESSNIKALRRREVEEKEERIAGLKAEVCKAEASLDGAIANTVRLEKELAAGEKLKIRHKK